MRSEGYIGNFQLPPAGPQGEDFNPIHFGNRDLVKDGGFEASLIQTIIKIKINTNFFLVDQTAILDVFPLTKQKF